MTALLVAVAGFLIGSIPFGVFVGRMYGVDIRAKGSGNIGAANALRTLGKGAGAAVLVLDALKGAAGVALGAHLGDDRWLPALGGFAAVCGHCYSPWLGWRGGKGVATSLGAIFALAWPAGFVFVLIWIVAVVATGYASVGSLAASILVALALWRFAALPAFAYGIAAALVIVLAHRENIARLRSGNENRVFAKER